MDEEKLLKITNDPVKVMEIIQTIAEAFPTIFEEINHYARDAYSFYHDGHCTTFARIMYEIFDGHAMIMDSRSHVIIRIGDRHFDITGCIDGLVDMDEFRDCPIEYFPMMEETSGLGRKDDHDEELAQIFIKLGKAKLLELVSTLETGEMGTTSKTM
ncbi:MAG TPA: hypothetical protein DCY94_04140 [Firmicutes bacterium]|nr:hypothetical protein [Bacillota bacterium]